MVATYRLAREDEDNVLACILYNAFSENWDINWWQSLRAPMRTLPSTSKLPTGLTWKERARLDFYRAVVKMTRLMRGTVAVAQPEDESVPAAVLCWLPPGVSPTAWAVLRSGLFWAVLRFGPIGMYRFISFERSLDILYPRVLRTTSYKKSDGGFVQVVATSPKHSGKGLSRGLLEWQIAQHRAIWPSVPVFLDTANEYSVRLYERLGFRELGRQELHVSKGSTLDRYRREDYIQVVMVL